MTQKPRKPQPLDALRTRIELEIYAKKTGKSMVWVSKVLDARAAKRR